MSFAENRGKVKTALALKIGGLAMMDAVKKYGSEEVVKLLIAESSKGDWVADELLGTFSTVVETDKFLSSCEWVWKPSEKEFECFVKGNHICWG